MNRRKVKLLFSAAAAAATLCGCRMHDAACQDRRPDYGTLISHRGESYDAPENTMSAFRMAVERGFGFECDIYLSKDGKLFTFHDGTLARTTNGKSKKRCVETDWDELSKLNVGGWGKWKGSKFDPERPALLEEVLELVRPGRKIYVEVKGRNPEWVKYIKEVVAKSKATPETMLFISFSAEVCRELKRMMPEYKAYWLTSAKVHPTADSVIKVLKDIGADGVDISFNKKIITKEYVDKVLAAGYELHVWTLDDLELVLMAFERGAMTVTTNRAKFLRDEYKKSVGGWFFW